MTAVATLLQETDTGAAFDVALSGPRRSLSLRFSVTSEGALGFDNRQPGARACAGRQLSLALASEMARAHGRKPHTHGRKPAHVAEMHMAVFPGRQGRNNRPVRAVIGGQQAS